MYKPSTPIGALMRTGAADILGIIVPVALRSEEQRIDRRLLKALEELGEISQAYLDVTGSGRKGKTRVDLLEEKVDLFVVTTDIVIRQAMLEGIGAWRVTSYLQGELTADLLASDEDPMLTPAFTAQQLACVTNALGVALTEAPFSRNTLRALHREVTRLLLTPETASDEEGRDAAATLRLAEIVQMFKVKCAKWEKTLNSATKTNAEVV